jgi:hypothetical protein
MPSPVVELVIEIRILASVFYCIIFDLLAQCMTSIKKVGNRLCYCVGIESRNDRSHCKDVMTGRMKSGKKKGCCCS